MMNVVKKKTIIKNVKDFFSIIWSPLLVNLVFFILARVIEGVLLSRNHQLEHLWRDVSLGFLLDVPVFAVVSILGVMLMLAFYPIGKKLSVYTGVGAFFIFHLFHWPVLYFFILTYTPLDRLVFAHSLQEITTTISTAGINYASVIFLLIAFSSIFWIAAFAFLSLKPGLRFAKYFSIGILFWLVAGLLLRFDFKDQQDYRRQMIHKHKSAHFYSDLLAYFKGGDSNPFAALSMVEQVKKYQQLFNHHKYASDQYPFLVYRPKNNPLGRYFPVSERPPSIVMIIVEGLGNDFIDSREPLSLMPFLYSLKEKSLYWDHFLGTGERSYAVLPSMIGSLPHGEIGFSMLRDMPLHLTLVNQLAPAGYQTGFFYGQGGYFHEKQNFLKRNNIDVFVDKTGYSDEFTIIYDAHTNYNWGYHDQDLFRNYFKISNHDPAVPQLDIFFTGTMHSPFAIDQEEHYRKRFREVIENANLDNHTESFYLQYERFLKTLLFTDDALQYFFTRYAEQKDYENTIFVITGDHPMTEIPIENLLKRYHVPLIIYSPMLQYHSRFSSISSQFDVFPTLVNLLEQNFGVHFGDYTHLSGVTLDTTAQFSSGAVVPLMRGNRMIDEIVSGEYFLSGNQLFKISEGFNLVPLANDDKAAYLRNKLHAYNVANNIVITSGRLIPDSVFFANTRQQLIGDTLVNFHINDNSMFYNIQELPLDSGAVSGLTVFIRGEVTKQNDSQLPLLVLELRDAENEMLKWHPVGLEAFTKSSSAGEVKYFNRYLVLDFDVGNNPPYLFKAYLWNENKLNLDLSGIEFKLFSFSKELN